MAKGDTCPSCGGQTFHKVQAYRQCSNCKTVGWNGEPMSAGGGKGAICKQCGESRVRRVYANIKRKFRVMHCYGCKVTSIERT